MAKKTLKDQLTILQREHAMTRGGVNTTARGIEMTFRKERLTRRLVYGILVLHAVNGIHFYQGVALDPQYAASAGAASIVLIYAYDWIALRVRRLSASRDDG